MSRLFRAILFSLLVVMTACDSPESTSSFTDETGPAVKAKDPAKTPPKASDSTGQSEAATPKATDEESAKDLVMDWPNFRGPGWLATSSNARVPLKWNSEKNLLWKTKLVGRGASSPIVVGDRIFLTAFTGYGMSAKERGNVKDLQHHVICIDKKSGESLWTRTIQGSYATQRLSDNVMGHGFASSTPVTDGEAIYAFFGVSGVHAFDLDGKFLWQQDVGTGTDNFGSSASLTVHDDLLFVNASIESQSVFALDKKTGNAAWKFEDVQRSWTTPVIVDSDGKTVVLYNETDTLHGIDAKTGKEIWNCEAIQDYVVPVPVVVDGICYANGGREKRLMAITTGGEGDVTHSHKLWEVPMGANVSSSVFHDDLIFLCADNGIMQVFDAESGDRLNQQRMGSKQRILASPTLVGGHLFLPIYDKGVVVVKADEDCKIVSRNRFEDDDTPLQACIAVSGNRLLLRSDNYLYCVGRNEKAPKIAEVKLDEDAEVIVPTKKFDFDEKERRLKHYVSYFETDPDALVKHILKPYESVITPEQVVSSTKIIKENQDTFLHHRKQYFHLKWRFMRGNIEEAELVQKLARIEKITMNHNQKVRRMVKKQFSKEQMDQHIQEAAERAEARKKAQAKEK